jgi:Arc/MetJ family transcription regulator
VRIFCCIIDVLRYADDVARTTIDINDEVLERAARELGTSNKVDTVNAALTFVAERRQLAVALEDPLMWGSPDLADPSVRAAARR